MNEVGGTPEPGIPVPREPRPITPLQPLYGPSDSDRKRIRIVKVIIAIGVVLFVILPILLMLFVALLYLA